MILARVLGATWSTIHHPIYEGRIVFEVEPITPDDAPAGARFLAIDCVGAGPGERVLVAREGNTARQVLRAHEQPVHSVIVGIVDATDSAR
jgi:ethanolamine utilization protein EutN